MQKGGVVQEARPSVEALLSHRTLTFHFGGESLVESAKGGDSTAFATLCEQYREQLFRAAHRITRDREDAEDAVQDALLRALVYLRDFEGRSNFGTWLTRITINSALMILRKKRAASEIAIDGSNDFGLDGLRDEITDRSPNPETCYMRAEEHSALMTAIRSLRPTLQVVVLIQLRDLSMRETAEAIGVSLAAAKGRAFHAKKTLRRWLNPRVPSRGTGDMEYTRIAGRPAMQYKASPLSNGGYGSIS